MATTYSFTAAQIETSADEDVLLVTFDSGQDHYLMLPRHPDFGSEDDWGVYIEIHSQAYCGYELTESCVLSETSLSIRLKKPLNDSERISVATPSELKGRAEGVMSLRRLFSDDAHRDQLTVLAGPDPSDGRRAART